MGKNIVVAQSGGPSPVINSSLRGIVETCRAFPDRFNRIYAGYHGIEGILKEELLDLTDQCEEEISLLRTTPAAGCIGTCRYKLKSHQREDLERILDVFSAHEVGYFFYIGGNDSMDTANKVGLLAAEKGVDVSVTGIPKTIDNDIGDQDFKLIDHTPGYGSVARYWSTIVQYAEEENRGSSTADPVLVLQAMGRKTGFIPAASRLADPDRCMPLQLYLKESGYTLDDIPDLVNDQIKKSGRAVLVVSEGFPVGDIGEARDAFDHVEYGASDNTAAQAVVSHLNKTGIKTRGVARGQVPGTDQRSAIVYASTVDLDEAYKVAQKAVEVVLDAGSGYMATILRRKGFIYQVEYGKVSLKKVANSERSLPESWIAENRLDVTDDFLAYARPLTGDDWVSVPLIDGRMRFARIKPVLVEKRCSAYVPEGNRKEK